MDKPFVGKKPPEEIIVIAKFKEIKDLKRSSIASINKIAVETSSEIIRQIIGTEVNKSNVSAIVDDILKRNKEKYISW